MSRDIATLSASKLFSEASIFYFGDCTSFINNIFIVCTYYRIVWCFRPIRGADQPRSLLAKETEQEEQQHLQASSKPATSQPDNSVKELTDQVVSEKEVTYFSETI